MGKKPFLQDGRQLALVLLKSGREDCFVCKTTLKQNLEQKWEIEQVVTVIAILEWEVYLHS